MNTYLEQTEFSRAGRAGYAGGFEGEIPCAIGRVISWVLQGMGVDSVVDVIGWIGRGWWRPCILVFRECGMG